MKFDERDLKYGAAHPGKGAAGKTGLWRVGRKPAIDPDKCTMCGLCELYCPDNAIDILDYVVIDYNYCKGCFICMRMCPLDAISVEEEDHG